MRKKPAVSEKVKSPSVQKKIKAIERVMLWTTITNIANFIGFLIIVYLLLR